MKANKIIRVKETITHLGSGIKTENVYLTSYYEYAQSKNWMNYLKTVELYPYKWYDINKFIDYPFYFLSKMLGPSKSMKMDTKSNIIKAAKIIFSIIGIVASVLGIIDFFR